MSLKAPTLEKLNEIRDEGFRPGITSCFINDHKLLFLYKIEYKSWVLSQGGIEPNEIPEEAFVRETKEELGSAFLLGCEPKLTLVHEERLEFSEFRQGVKPLKNSKGEDINMKGKHYFFYAVPVMHQKVDIKQTQFDDYCWVDFKLGSFLSSKMVVKNKAKVIVNLLNKLRDQGLIK